MIAKIIAKNFPTYKKSASALVSPDKRWTADR
jgi:hypothetical protein